MARLDWSKNKRKQMAHNAAIEQKMKDAYLKEVGEARRAEPTIPQPRLGARDMVIGTEGLRTTVMHITPLMATEWLEGNTHNRPLRQNDVEIYASFMRDHKWRLNGESIIFDHSGKLLDGQHRLWACVESDTPFDSVVVFGASPEAFTTIDQGRHRSGADHLHVAKVPAKNMAAVAAVATLILRYRTDQLFAQRRLSPELMVNLLKNEPEITWWVEESLRSRALRKLATPVAATLYLGSMAEGDKARAFMEQWRTGLNLTTGSPVLALRQRTLNGPVPFRAIDRLYITVTAWNAFVTGRSVMRVQAMRGDKFPHIEGERQRRDQ